MFDLVIINDNLDKAYATLKQALSEVGPSLSTLSWHSTSTKSKSPWGPGEDLRPSPPWFPASLDFLFSFFLAGNQESSGQWPCLRVGLIPQSDACAPHIPGL